MKPQVSVLKSFICGAVIQLAAISGGYTSPGLLFFCAILLPGFVYSIFLINGEPRNIKNALFVILGGGLNIATAISAPWLSDTYKSGLPYFLIVGTSCALFFVFYHFLVCKTNLLKGMVLAFVVGLIASILPMIAESVDKKIGFVLYVILFFSSFPVWTTLFAVVINQTAKKQTGNIIPQIQVTGQ